MKAWPAGEGCIFLLGDPVCLAGSVCQICCLVAARESAERRPLPVRTLPCLVPPKALHTVPGKPPAKFKLNGVGTGLSRRQTLHSWWRRGPRLGTESQYGTHGLCRRKPPVTFRCQLHLILTPLLRTADRQVCETSKISHNASVSLLLLARFLKPDSR